MSDNSIEKIRERIARLKEKSSTIAGKLGHPPDKKMPAPAAAGAVVNRNASLYEGQIKNLEQEKEMLMARISQMEDGAKLLKERISMLESEKKELSAGHEAVVEKIEKQERETWIRFSLNIMKEYVGELFRYLRHTSSMAREAIEMCMSDKQIDDATKKKIEVVDDMYKKTLQLVEESKIKFTFPELRKSSFLVSDMVNNVVSRISGVTGGKINFNARFSNPNLRASGDQALLEEMLTCIIQNSVEAIAKQGSVDIEVRKEPGFIIMEITDTGSGIPPHLINKAFNPFFTTKNEGGSIGHLGLGLTRAYWICQLHGGEIELESQLKKGTKAIISLPGGDDNAAA